MSILSSLLPTSALSKDDESLLRQSAKSAHGSAVSATFAEMVATQEDKATIASVTEQKRDPNRPENDSVVKEFLDYMSKSVAERLRDQILKEKGLTEADLEAMPPEKRLALEEEIAQRITDHLREAAAGDIEKQQQAALANIQDIASSLLNANQPKSEEDDLLLA